MDFSAWMEVYLGGQWRTLDARHNTPRIGRVMMAMGRDATDVAIITNFGPATLAGFKERSPGQGPEQASLTCQRCNPRPATGLARCLNPKGHLMRIRSGYEITYDCPHPTPMVLMLSLRAERLADLETPDLIHSDPPTPLSQYQDQFGNLCSRLV
eukprot:gene16602-22518_t